MTRGSTAVPGHPAVAKGLFEGITAGAADDIKALRIARPRTRGSYLPDVHDQHFRMFGWNQFTPQELASADRSASAATRHLRHRLRRAVAVADDQHSIKVIVLNTGIT
jgi:pyruvate-ferredoxin/flavodoxin oxidoreductase